MINLAPASVKDRYRAYSLAYTVTVIYVIVIAVLGLGALVLATRILTLNAGLDDKQNTLARYESDKKKNLDLLKQAGLVEDRLKNAAQYQETRHWETIIHQVADITPTDIQLTSLKTAIETGKPISLTLIGKTTNQRSILLMRDQLKNQGWVLTSAIQIITEGKAESGSGKAYTFTIATTLKNDVTTK